MNLIIVDGSKTRKKILDAIDQGILETDHDVAPRAIRVVGYKFVKAGD